MARPCAALDEASDRIAGLERMVDDARLVRGGTTVVLVTSTASPGSGPTRFGIHRVLETP